MERLLRWLPRPCADVLRIFADSERSGELSVPVGAVRFGDLRQLTPISRVWGFDRGLPIDRHYIEGFLGLESSAIRGRVLEIGDNAYTRKFGGSRVAVSDVLHVKDGNPHATIVGDLTRAEHVPSNTFDCIILTQTLQLIYDAKAAIETVHRILAPGGVVLATVPGVTPISDSEWGPRWCWNFTTLSARRVFSEVFAEGNVSVKTYGNVLTAIGFLHGLAAEELTPEELDFRDHNYEVVIAIKAVKPATM